MPTAINTCVLFTSSTLRIVYIIIMSHRHMFSFLISKDNGLMSWVGTRMPWVSKPGLLGNFPPHRGRSLPSEDIPFSLRLWVLQGQDTGQQNFPSLGMVWTLIPADRSLKDSVPRTRECSESPCPTSHLTDQNTEAQSLTKGHREIADGVFGWNP